MSLSLISVLSFCLASNLSLEDYLSNVVEGNGALHSSRIRSQAGFLKESEAWLLYSPQLSADAHFVLDEKQNSNPNLFGTQTDLTSYSLGVSQTTPVGLKGSFHFQLDHYETKGASQIADPKYYQSTPSLEASLSLWRNLLGSETRAAHRLLESNALQQAYAERYAMKERRSQAEASYWRLMLAREATQIMQDVLARTKTLLEWSQRRAKLNLADRSDLLQTQAAYQMKEMDLKKVLDDEREARLQFNLARGIQSDVVPEELELPKMDALKPPERLEARDDLKASEESTQLAVSNAEVSKQKTMPNLELYGSYTFNAKNNDFSAASSDLFSNAHPTKLVGIRLSTPLLFWSQKKTIEAYQMDKRAAEANHRQLVLVERAEWENTIAKFDMAKTRLNLATKLEAAQREKVLHERSRHQQGRSTTYQVILFEQDYSNSRLSRLQIESELLGLHSQLKKWSVD